MNQKRPLGDPPGTTTSVKSTLNDALMDVLAEVQRIQRARLRARERSNRAAGWPTMRVRRDSDLWSRVQRAAEAAESAAELLRSAPEVLRYMDPRGRALWVQRLAEELDLSDPEACSGRITGRMRRDWRRAEQFMLADRRRAGVKRAARQ